MINGQALGDVSKLKYGLFPMSFNGCEVIAVCNALEYLGIKRPVGSVLRYMRRYCVLLGLFGCNVYCVGRALKHFGVDCMRIKSADASKAFIISSWTGKPFLSSIHTVFCVNEGERIRVYNRYNSCPTEKYYDSAEKIFDNCRVLTIYKITGRWNGYGTNIREKRHEGTCGNGVYLRACHADRTCGGKSPCGA